MYSLLSASVKILTNVKIPEAAEITPAAEESTIDEPAAVESTEPEAEETVIAKEAATTEGQSTSFTLLN